MWIPKYQKKNFFIMKKLNLLIVLLSILSNLQAQLSLEYYFPPETKFNITVPTPQEVIGFVPGEWHISHDQTILYFKTLAENSDRVVLLEYGRTYQNRPLFHVIITSPDNHKNIEEIRKNHIALANPALSEKIKIENMPAVVRLGFGVHGNEASAHNAAPFVAYYYAAAQGAEIDDILKNTIILIDPSMNPDGQQRFSTWVNMHKSKNPVTDPENREFRDVWPGSRTNHYWFDLNRDWVIAQHPESRGRMLFYHMWKPVINTDHHEFGANSTFFFQPGVPARTNPLTPDRTIELTNNIGKFHAKALDEKGVIYFTEEVFDDFYIGKGSTFPDLHGSVGILFEQAGIRGHLRETNHGLVDFPTTIRNQVAVSFSTINAAQELRIELLENLREFYSTAITLSEKEPIKAYVFGEPYDKGKMYHFFELLQLNNIEIFELTTELNIENNKFEPGNSFLIPLNQPQFRLIQSLFQKVTSFEDSIFYDVSSWVMPLAFNIPSASINNLRQAENLKGRKVEAFPFPKGGLSGTKSQIGYVFQWDEYYAPKLLYSIQNAGLRTMVGTREFKMATSDGGVEFSQGSIFIPTALQSKLPDEIYQIIKKQSAEAGIKVYSVTTSLTMEGIDIGSGNFVPLSKPEILMIIGEGISSLEAGEIWHLLDQRFNMPVTKIEISRFNNLDLHRYNTIIMPEGSYDAVSDEAKNRLPNWVENGGNIVALRTANNWLAEQKIISINIKRAPPIEIPYNIPYTMVSEFRSARSIPGTIFENKIDITHPIGFGYRRNVLPIFKTGSLSFEKTKLPSASPVIITQNPLISGYAHPSLIEPLKGTASIVVSSKGRGSIISFADNPNFRGYWFGTNKLFLNSIFFGEIIRI